MSCLTGRVILAHEAIACPGLFVAPATIPSLSSMRVVHTPYMVHVYRAHLALTFENVFALHAHAFNIALNLAVAPPLPPKRLRRNRAPSGRHPVLW